MNDDILRLLGDFRAKFLGAKFRHRHNVNLDADLRALSQILKRTEGRLEFEMLKGAIYEAYIKGKIIISASTSNSEADWNAIFFCYRRKLKFLSIAYPHLHYYENYMRSSLAKYINEQIGSDWLSPSLIYMSRHYTQRVNRKTESIFIEIPNTKILKEFLLENYLPIHGTSNNFYDVLFSNTVKYFRQQTRGRNNLREVQDLILKTNLSKFLSSLSINSIQIMILYQWHLMHKMPEFGHAVKNGYYRSQLRDAFQIISSFRNNTYHHTESSGSSKAIKKMRQIVPFPIEIIDEYERQKTLITKPTRQSAKEIEKSLSFRKKRPFPYGVEKR